MTIKTGLLLGFIVLLGLVFGQGMIYVDVKEHHDGMHIWLPVPVSLARLGVTFIPKDNLAEAAKQMQPWMPVIQTTCDELSRIPDTVLVQVDNSHEHVCIEKRGGSIYIDVNSNNDQVHISFPVHAVGSIVAQIARTHDHHL